jgi:hypothetical protein
MKVLCVVPSYWPAFQFGGPVTAVHCLNKVPIKKGVNLEVYTTNVGIEREVPVNNETSVDGIKTTYLSYIKYFEFLGDTGWQFSPRLIKALKNNLMK